MDEKKFQTIMNVLSLVLWLVLAGSFFTVARAALTAN
jgi:hypothetical protein